MIKKPKLLVILGPTSSGKTRLAVKLAMKFNGEIVSADSRQVYRGMDVGTGKDLKEFSVILEPKAIESRSKIDNNQMLPCPLCFATQAGGSLCKRSLPRCISGLQHDIIKIPHHLIDVVSPKKRFNLADYQRLAFKAIDDILARGKLPILVGGSGLYLQSVVDNYILSEAKPDSSLRKKLEKMNITELFSALKKQSPSFAKRLNQSDKNNKRRLIRYLEIVEQGSIRMKTGAGRYQTLLIGISLPVKELKEKIRQRLIDRLEKQDLIGEVERLHKQGLSWEKLESFGLEYKFVSQYLQKKLDYDEMVEKLNRAINQFTRRQMSWFRRWERQEKEIHWVTEEKQAEKLVKNFNDKKRVV